MSTEETAQDYLDKKADILTQCIELTETLLINLGDIAEAHQLLGQRKRLLMTLEQIDQQYAPLLTDYYFAPADLEHFSQLAEKMWLIDDQVTAAMQNHKVDFRAQLRNK